MKTLLKLSLMSLVVACSSVPTSRVVERADYLDAAPEWASVTHPFFESKSKLHFLGYVELDGEASKSAALNMSDEKAMSEPMKGLVDAFLDQNQIGEELRKESMVGQRIISSTRGYRPAMPGLLVSSRYWEVVRNADRLELRAYSLVEIPVEEFEKAKRDYLARLAGNSEVKKILTEVGAKQRDQLAKKE